MLCLRHIHQIQKVKVYMLWKQIESKIHQDAKVQGSIETILSDCPHNSIRGDNYGWECLDCGYKEEDIIE
jgi:hypothetical protein